jgi:DNA polymerase-3 subunit gamma/tau
LPKLGKLQNIRDKFTNKAIDNEQTIIPLSMEKLTEAWKIFTDQLKEKKNPAAQSFEMAELEIINESRFDIITNNNLEQRFIEHEKRKLCEYLQQYFRNKGLTLTIKVKENQDSYKPDDKHLNKREQYQKIIEQYPLVKELKDRLRMELDY